MPNYRVAWEIDIFDAPDPKTAARRALEIQKKRGNGPLLPDDATVFSVIDQDGDGEAIQIDLSQTTCEQCGGDLTTQGDGKLFCDECGHEQEDDEDQKGENTPPNSIDDLTDKELANMIRKGTYTAGESFGLEEGNKYLLVLAVPYGDCDGVKTVFDAMKAFHRLMKSPDWKERQFQIYDHTICQFYEASYEELRTNRGDV